jgi:hypothetical protein
MQQGAADAMHVVAHARSVGYVPYLGDPPPAIIKDMENLANPGPNAVACMQAYMRVLRTAGYQAPGYCGFNSGLTPEQWTAMVTPVMSDFGPRKPPPGRGFAIKQHAQVKIFGTDFDLDEVLVDLTGDQIVAMGNVELNDPSPPEPHS